MEYFKINYHRLENLHQINFYKIIVIFVSSLLIIVVFSLFIESYHKVSFSGIYSDNVLSIKINNKLSDILKNNKYIIFNKQKTSYEILEFGDYEIINNEVYQNVTLTIDNKKFINNEVGIVELYYDKEVVIKHILELFK